MHNPNKEANNMHAWEAVQKSVDYIEEQFTGKYTSRGFSRNNRTVTILFSKTV